ncbi:hypothetical protein E5843_00965 [Luteimonas yindakuii]|uniref:hypothetical protein n=1 Tax=Luteimonas yindakuii TaxID=2565782 RepID=UPI0010A4F854|nr:hypothetical protein [Luteimonas yindakuii]QCO66724.1 hypothetical protein E5843_00965 [Luteimonas yindakuii]
MNVQILTTASRREPSTQAFYAARQAPSASAHRYREFGIGYGSSSGYGRPVRYVDPSPALRFRLG